MKRKLLIFFLIPALIYTFPIKAASDIKYNIYTLEEEFFDTEVIHCIPCFIPPDASDEKKAEILLKTLLNNEQNMINYIPKGTALLGVSIHNDELIINVSKNIKNYGGSFYERKLVRQILYTAFEIESVNYVTLHIEGRLDYLPQGSLINKISRNDLRREFRDEGNSFCNQE